MATQLPAVTAQQKLKIRGESEVVTRLGLFANASKLDPDIGIDFMCELLDDMSPALPFYVQAKATKKTGDRWSTTIKKSTVRYWLKQSSPVFVIVYDANRDDCFWSAIEEMRYELVKKLQVNPSSRTIQFTMPKDQHLQKIEQQDVFVSAVRQGHASIQLARGYPQSKGGGYIRGLPDAPRTRFEVKRIRAAVRNGMYSLIQYYWDAKDFAGAERTARACTIFDDTHAVQFEFLARIQEQIND